MRDAPDGAVRWLLIPLLGAFLVWFGTFHGAGASRDSLRYLRGAENIAHGNGYSVIAHSGGLESVTHWPPLYSIVVAGPIAAGLSTTHSVRLVNCLAFFATLWLVGLLARRLAPSSRTAPLFAMACVLVAPAVLHDYLMTWSETIFIPLVLAGLVALLDYATRDRTRDLVVAALWLGLSAIDRYAGVAFIVGAAAALAFWDGRYRRTLRFARLLAFGAVAFAPTAIWFVRNVFATQHAHDRPFQPRAIGVDQVRAAVDAVSQWLLPVWFNLRVRALWLVLVVALAVVVWRRSAKTRAALAAPTRAFVELSVLSVAAYAGFVLVTMLFFDYEVNFDVRMMSPVYVIVVVTLAALAPHVVTRPRSRAMRTLATMLVASFLALAAYSVTHAWSSHRDPAQFAGARWQDARAWDVVASYPDSIPIYSAQPDVSEYFVGRGVQPLVAPDAALPADALLLHYPGLDGADASTTAIEALHPRTVDSTDVVVVYEVEK